MPAFVDDVDREGGRVIHNNESAHTHLHCNSFIGVHDRMYHLREIIAPGVRVERNVNLVSIHWRRITPKELQNVASEVRDCPNVQSTPSTVYTNEALSLLLRLGFGGRIRWADVPLAFE